MATHPTPWWLSVLRNLSRQNHTRSPWPVPGGFLFFLVTFLALMGLLGLELRSLSAQEKKEILTLERIFKGEEFREESLETFRWLKKIGFYTMKKESEEIKGAFDIVRVNAETGDSEVWVPASHLIPSGASSPLKIENFTWSDNEGLLLIYTNSKRVWRQNTRGDYWVYDTASKELRKLGGDAPPSSLMFATFSPDSRKVAYVRDRNIYVEDLVQRKIVQVTERKSPSIINGTFDWVYEEEFGLRNGFRWSPDSTMIAYWQLDTKGVGEYYLLNNTDGVYQELKKFHYPKAGTTNSACRIGIVRVDVPDPLKHKKSTQAWLDLYWGDPRNNYVAYLDWIPDTKTVVIQYLNRLQNKNTVYYAEVDFPNPVGRVYPNNGNIVPHSVFTDEDKAWVEVVDKLHWLKDKEKSNFLWLSDRDGWYHIYLVNSDDQKLVTPGDFDVIGLDAVDKETGWVYFRASPDNPTQQYLFRAQIDGSKVERITPKDQPGWHTYNISPDAKWAMHTYSRFDTPPVTELISLQDHKALRTVVDI